VRRPVRLGRWKVALRSCKAQPRPLGLAGSLGPELGFPGLSRRIEEAPGARARGFGMGKQCAVLGSGVAAGVSSAAGALEDEGVLTKSSGRSLCSTSR